MSVSVGTRSAVEEMDGLLLDVEREVEQQEYWQVCVSKETAPSFVMDFMREVMLEIWSYQKCVDTAVFAAVGRLGTSIDEQGLIRSMIAVQVEETGHGSLALADYLALGGDEEHARTRRPSPASQALIGTIRHLGEREHPLCHLGFMYFFEKFTTVMTEKIAPTLQAAGYPEERLEFMRLHAEEDIRHADMLGNVIRESEKRYAGARDHILYGFESFRIVYPHPVWTTAFRRAQEGA